MLKDKFDDKIFEFIEEDEKKVFPCFPLPIIVKNAENSCLYDINGNKYIDLTSNRENNPFGYTNILIKNQNNFLDSELFNSYGAVELEESLKTITGLEKAYFFSNLSDVYEYTHKLINIHLNNTGKGKILLSSVSSDRNLYKIENIKNELMPLNRDSILKTLFSRDIGAVIIQLSQKTDEFLIAEDDYLTEIKDLCEKKGALLVFDASNISPMRLGKNFFNYNTEIKPDILIVSKGLSQGFSLSSVIISKKATQFDILGAGSCIYSPAYTIANEFIKNFQSNKINEIIDLNIEYITKKLEEIAETHISFLDFYSTGMLFTIVVDISAYEFAKTAFKKGIIVDALNDSKIVISPPLNIKKEEIDYFISSFDKIFDEIAEFDRMK